MTPRKLLGFAALLLAAAASWYLARSLEEPVEITPPQRSSGQGFYLRSVRILGTDDQGDLLYEEGPEKIRQSIAIILDTERGERVMRPAFGCGLRRYLMKPNTTATGTMIAICGVETNQNTVSV